MTADHRSRHYIAFEAQDALADTYTAFDRMRTPELLQTIHNQAQTRLKQGIRQLGLEAHVTPRVLGHPSLEWRLRLADERSRSRAGRDKIWSVEFGIRGPYETALDRLGKIKSGLGAALPNCGRPAVAADLPLSVAEYWNPAEATSPLFGDRAAARRLLGVDSLPQAATSGLGVNVVVVDVGVDKVQIRNAGGSYGGGWERVGGADAAGSIAPGTTKRGHGAMMVRNILDIAPKATIFDCPLLPPRISNIRSFLSNAHAAYSQMLADIAYLRERHDRWRGPWLFVNAWAIFDRKSEHPLGDYTNNPHHPFNVVIEQAVDEGFDVIFCAGNCGQFCPVMKCGAQDRGPGHSIFGANSHVRVITAGATRVDGMWLGYSSQGPGQPLLSHHKPDFCAPAQFAETRDAYSSNTGSSAASGLTAGVVAALRTKWNSRALPPDALKEILVTSARKTEGNTWNSRLGHGILNAQTAFELATRRKA